MGQYYDDNFVDMSAISPPPPQKKEPFVRQQCRRKACR